MPPPTNQPPGKNPPPASESQKENKPTPRRRRMSETVDLANPYHQDNIYSPTLRLDQFQVTNTINPFRVPFDLTSNNEKFDEREMFKLRRNASYLLHVEEKIFQRKEWQFNRFKDRVSMSFKSYTKDNAEPDYKLNGLYGFIFYNESLLLLPILHRKSVNYLYVRCTHYQVPGFSLPLYITVSLSNPNKAIHKGRGFQDLLDAYNNDCISVKGEPLKLTKGICRPIPPWSIKPVKIPNVVTEEDLLKEKIEKEKLENKLIVDELNQIERCKKVFSGKYSYYLELPNLKEIQNSTVITESERVEMMEFIPKVEEKISSHKKKLHLLIMNMTGSEERATNVVDKLEKDVEEKHKADLVNKVDMREFSLIVRTENEQAEAYARQQQEQAEANAKKQQQQAEAIAKKQQQQAEANAKKQQATSTVTISAPPCTKTRTTTATATMPSKICQTTTATATVQSTHYSKRTETTPSPSPSKVCPRTTATAVAPTSLNPAVASFIPRTLSAANPINFPPSGYHSNAPNTQYRYANPTAHTSINPQYQPNPQRFQSGTVPQRFTRSDQPSWQRRPQSSSYQNPQGTGGNGYETSSSSSSSSLQGQSQSQQPRKKKYLTKSQRNYYKK